jgi:hypothetical protein
MREGRVLSRRSSSTPSEGEAHLPAPDAGLGFDGLMHHWVRAEALGTEQHDLSRLTYFCRAFAVIDQSAEPIKVGRREEKEMPVRMPQTRTPRVSQESIPGFKCQI